MAYAFTDSDFASKMAVQANDHRRFFDQFGRDAFRTYRNRADQRVQGWTHRALNHQPHNSEY